MGQAALGPMEWLNPIFYGNNAPSFHTPVVAATTVAGTLASSFVVGSTIDGVTLSLGDRLLIKNQASSTENGIYIVQSSGAPKRSLDLPSGQSFAGVSAYVTGGTTNGGSVWTCITIGNTGAAAMTFSQSDVLGLLNTNRGGLGGNAAAPDDGDVPIAQSGAYLPGPLSAGEAINVASAAGALSIGLATPIGVEDGGSGSTGEPAAGQILLGTNDNVYICTDIVAGANVTLAVGPGSLHITTCSTHEFGTVASVLDPTINYSALQVYAQTSAPTLFTLTDASFDGQLKEIALSDEAVSTVQVRTGRGSILLGQPLANDRTAHMYWDNNVKVQWGSVEQGAGLTWITDTQQARLLGTGGTSALGNANAVALSADGNTLLAGDSTSNKCFYWTRTGTSTWSGATKVPMVSDPQAGNSIGSAVAISSDGLTIALGAKAGASNKGAAWIFVFTSGAYHQQGSRLQGSGGSTTDLQGASVALANNGSTLLIGAPGNSTNAGAFWIFTRSGTTWTQFGSKLAPTGLSSTAAAGTSAALSSDGMIAVLGAPGNPVATGSIVIWSGLSGTWTQLQAITTFAGSVGSANIGASITCNVDATTIAVGGPADNTNAGAVWVFTATTEGGTYALQGSKLVGTGAGGAAAAQGSAVVLSKKGDTLYVGGPGDTTAGGAVWSYVRFNSLWQQPLAKIVSTGGSGGAIGFGTAIGAGADARTLAASAPADAAASGSVYIFV